MKQKNYTFERVNGTTDHVELHRKGHHFHLLARLLCLLLAVVFWLLISALKTSGTEKDDAKGDKNNALYVASCIYEAEA